MDASAFFAKPLLSVLFLVSEADLGLVAFGMTVLFDTVELTVVNVELLSSLKLEFPLAELDYELIELFELVPD